MPRAMLGATVGVLALTSSALFAADVYVSVATMSNKVDMYANRYPLEDALKLFGAVEGFGAQMPK